MSKGYVGRGLFVDLNSGAIEDEALPEIEKMVARL